MIGLGQALALALAPKGAGGGAPAVPTGFQVTGRAQTTLTLQWTSDAVARLQVQPAGGDWSSLGEAFPVTSPFVVTGCMANTHYDVRIRAEEAGLVSDWVTLTNLRTLPDAPTDLVVTKQAPTTLTIEFAGAGGQMRCQVQPAGGDWSSVGNAYPVTSPFVVTGCEPDTYYDIRVRAESDPDVSVWTTLTNQRTLTAGLPEITQIVAVADVAGSLHGKKIAISDANGRVGVYLDCGPKVAEFTLDFSAVDLASFATGAVGLWMSVRYGATYYYFWFNSGTEYTPSFGIYPAFEVNVSSCVDAAAVVDTLLSSLLANSPYLDHGSSGPVLHMIAPSAQDGSGAAGTSGALFTGITDGRAELSAPTGYDRTIKVSIADGFEQSTTAAYLASAINADDAFTATYVLVGELLVAIVTDNAVGSRTDAADVNTGFTISVTQQGEDPS